MSLAPPDGVRVALFQAAPPTQLAITGIGPWTLVGGSFRVRLRPRSAVTITVAGNQLVLGLPQGPVTVPTVRATCPAGFTLAHATLPPRPFTGDLTVRPRGATLLPILAVPFEAYVAAVVGAEVPPDWPSAALAAQAIATRSFTLARRAHPVHTGYDACDLTHCQRFRGLAGADRRVRGALDATADLIATYHGRPIEALWSATCAGTRYANDAVFGGAAVPYLAGGADRDPAGQAWCAASPHAAPWTARYPLAKLANALRHERVIGAAEPLAGLEVVSRDGDGPVRDVAVLGNRPHHLTGYQLWMALGPHFGWGEIKGPGFAISRQGPDITFSGRGLGHGVGMCQWGARGRALAHWTPEAIISAYFPGTRLISRFAR